MSGLEFAWPLVALLWPVPLLIYFLAPRAQPQARHALKVPQIDQFSVLLEGKLLGGSNRWLARLLFLVLWSALVVAGMNPQYPSDPILIETRSRDLMLAVDLSDSMRERDFKLKGRVVDRLQASKAVAAAFVENRHSDRIGLVLFGSQAFLHSPFTLDHKSLMTLLNETEHGLAGPQTAIGDAIALSVKHVVGSDAEKRVLILMTDGTNTSGNIEPLDAAQLAAKHKLKIYTIGIGSSFNRQRPYGSNRGVDENLLQEIAAITGGRYFLARSTKELSEIYSVLDQVEKIDRKDQYFRPQISVYHFPLSIALLTSLAYFRVLRKIHQ